MKQSILLGLTAAVGVTCAVLPAAALPEVGAIRSTGTVMDADDHPLDLRSINGKPILVLYEDKDSATMNAPLKAELARLAKGDRYKTAVALVPVADVQGFDFWPIRGFVKDSIRSESKKVGATIYCDWDGAFQRASKLKRGTSSVVLIGRNARVLFAASGALTKEQRDLLIELLRVEVEAGP